MTYDEFWLRYLRAHRHPSTRALHYLGTTLSLACLIIAVALQNWWFLLATPVVGYGFAWTAHAALEGNRPETFGHPFWSLVSDVRMLALFVSGQLAPHLARAGLP